MRLRFAALLAAVMFVLSAASLTAHHSFDGQYDRNKPLSLVGKVVDVEWINPHCRMMILVTNSDGTKTVWRGESRPPHVMIQNGWERTLAESMAKSGETVTIKGYASKHSSGDLYATELTRADGKTMLKLSGEPQPPSATTLAIEKALNSGR